MVPIPGRKDECQIALLSEEYCFQQLRLNYGKY